MDICNSRHFKKFTEIKGFTLVEMMMVGLIISLITGGVWAVYFSIVNVYYQEQRDALIQGGANSFSSRVFSVEKTPKVWRSRSKSGVWGRG